MKQEFASVLGHEIGHITARHGASQYSKTNIGSGSSGGRMVVSEDFRKFSDLASTGLGLLLKFGRSDESESDEIGVVYSTNIGYNAHMMGDFSRPWKLLAQNPAVLFLHFIYTPRSGRPIQQSTWNCCKVSKIRGVVAADLKVNRDSYLKMIDGLVYGEDPQTGLCWKFPFYHPEMKFTFEIPKDWQVVNSASQVQMAPKDGKALMFLQFGIQLKP